MNLFKSAEYAASLSNCKKKQVGAALSINGEVVSVGFNHPDAICKCDLSKTNPHVIHAEVACLEHYEFLGNDLSELAVTYICCLDCSEYILRKGVKRVYVRDWREDKTQGVKFLQLNGVNVSHFWEGKERFLDE